MSLSKTSRVAVVALASASLALAGCSGGSTGNKQKDTSTSAASGSASGGAATPTKMLNMYQGAGGAFTENYNPFSPAVMNMVGGAIYETLFYYNPLGAADQKPTPMLGTDMKWNSDGTQLDVTTRDGVKWNDGQPFTAKDVAFTFDLINKTPALNTSGLKMTATATDDTHVTFKFDSPAYTQGPNVLSRTFIVPEHIWKDVKDPTTAINKNPVGTGPFMYGSFTPQAYEFKRNPNYWQAGLPKIGGIRVLSLNGNNAGVDNLLAGKIDYTSMFIPNVDKVLSANKNLSSTNTGLGQMVLASCSSAAMGCTGPQTDVNVRKAIYYGINRDQLNKLAFSNTASKSSPAYVLLPRDESYIADGVDKEVPWDSADVAKAQDYLTKAGYTKGADGYYAKGGQKLTVTIAMPTGWTDYITAADTMKQQLKQVGIDVNPTQVAYSEYTNQCASGKYQFVMYGMNQGPAPDPWYVYDQFFGSSHGGKVGQTGVSPYQNISRFSDPKVDAAIKAAGGTLDQAKRKEQYAIIQKALEDNMPYVPVLQTGGLTEYNSANFTGWPTQDNLYVYPMSWSSVDSTQVLLHVQEK